MTKIATTGATIAGMRVVRLLVDLLAADEVGVEVDLVVDAAVAVLRVELDAPFDRNEENSEASVTVRVRWVV